MEARGAEWPALLHPIRGAESGGIVRFRFPHPLVLLVAIVGVAAMSSRVLPAGEYVRRQDEVTQREVVVPGTFHRVEQRPVGAFAAAVAIPRGMVDAASVIFFVFLVGGAFAVVEQTGALERAVNWLVHRLENRPAIAIPISCLAFGTGGALMHMAEELIAFVPVLLLLVRRLGFNPLTAVAMSMGASAVAAAFSPVDPFMVIIAQKVAGLPVQSAAGFRTLFMLAALALWTVLLMWYATRTRTEPEAAAVEAPTRLEARHVLVLGLVLVAFALLVIGMKFWDWYFDELSALFFVMGIAAGLVGGLKLTGTAEALIAGFRSMAFAALLIGFARAIYIVLDQGRIIDSIVHGLFLPIAQLPVALSALGMFGAQTLIHFPVPSTSGQAVLTLPVLVPLSDLIGLSRQVTVLAYQYGAGLCELLTPTNGALVAMLAATGTSFGVWLRFVLPRLLALAGLGMGAILIAIAIGLQ
jgi:uncharacterized ion transporter superfamily protein YfcC